MDSKLQIISGAYRGRRLRLPPDARPTQNRARIALFNMIESGVVDTSGNLMVWDAFAGSGAFGIECLSRYAGARVVFTDTSPTSIKTIRDNLATLAVGVRASVVQMDAIGAVNKYGVGANLIFVDPPYVDENLGRALAHTGRDFPDSEIIGDLTIYADMNGFDENLNQVANDYLNESVRKMEKISSTLNSLGILLVSAIIAWVVLGTFQMQDQITSVLS